jgi:CBS domain containing-hemolysin-like protein
MLLTCFRIIPQALCVRFGLAIGYYTSWLVRILMYGTWPISYPIGRFLDYVLGVEHGDHYKVILFKTNFFWITTEKM